MSPAIQRAVNPVAQSSRDAVAKVFAWLQQPEKAYARWQGKTMVVAAWAGLFLAVINPPAGSGITVCLLKVCTGISCPGCGMTRSLSCALRGMFAESWHYHPFGLFILALFIATAIGSLLPSAGKKRVAAYVESHAIVFNALYLVFALSFVSFGMVRALLEFFQHFPLH